MSAATKDLAWEQGATNRLPFTYARGIDQAGVPIDPYDLTGASAKLQVRAKYGAAEIILELSSADGTIELGGVEGTVVIVCSDELTEAMGPLDKPVKGIYDLKITWPSGDETRLLEGKVTIKPSVTWDGP